MISIWEAVQGLLFMGVFGGIVRAAFQERPVQAPSAPQAASQAVLIPLPRTAVEEEHGRLPIG